MYFYVYRYRYRNKCTQTNAHMYFCICAYIYIYIFTYLYPLFLAEKRMEQALEDLLDAEILVFLSYIYTCLT